MLFTIQIIREKDSSDVATTEPMTREELLEVLPVLLKPSMFGNKHFYLVINPAN